MKNKGEGEGMKRGKVGEGIERNMERNEWRLGMGRKWREGIRERRMGRGK